MSSTNKTSLGLNMWEASDKPVRQDFVKDNVIINDEVTKLKQDIGSNNTVINEKINKLNSNLTVLNNNKANSYLDGLTNMVFGRAVGRSYMRFTVSVTLFYQVEFYDNGTIVLGRSEDNNWTVLWSK